MTKIKSFTSLEQSRKLAEILPLESADYHYITQGEKSYFYPYSLSSDAVKHYDEEIKYIPCWSIAAMLSLIRETIGYTIYGVNNVYMSCNLGDKPWKLETEVYDNEVDVCYEMIIKLNDLNLL